MMHASQLQVAEGLGSAHGHHGEILQGIFYGGDHQLHRGLVTLPWLSCGSAARFRPDGGTRVRVETPGLTKAHRAAELTGMFLTGAIVGGTLEIENATPIGRGVGSSTSDVVATIRAVARSLGADLTSYDIGKLSVAAEKASDAIMFPDHAVLFAQREGDVLKHFGGPLPKMVVLGFDTRCDTIIDTLTYELPAYKTDEIETFRVLLGLLSHAIHTQNVSLIGRVATASSRINQKYLAKPCFNEMLAIAEYVGAVGVQVAHSGTVAGLILDPQLPRIEQSLAIAKNQLEALGFITYELQV